MPKSDKGDDGVVRMLPRVMIVVVLVLHLALSALSCLAIDSSKVDYPVAIHIDGRGMDKSPVWHDMVYKTMKDSLEAMNWKKPPYSTRYPLLAMLEKVIHAC
jgi:hypothetical protein